VRGSESDELICLRSHSKYDSNPELAGSKARVIIVLSVTKQKEKFFGSTRV
jgi:hypothetical protein